MSVDNFRKDSPSYLFPVFQQPSLPVIIKFFFVNFFPFRWLLPGYGNFPLNFIKKVKYFYPQRSQDVTSNFWTLLGHHRHCISQLNSKPVDQVVIGGE